MMEDKRLDFDAPLLSTRRFATAAPPPPPPPASSVAASTDRAVASERPRKASLPFYRSELKSGPVRNPGVVPFVWEQTPGQPKHGGSDPPGRISKQSEEAADVITLPISSSSSENSAVKSVERSKAEAKASVEAPISEEHSGGVVSEEDEEDDAFSDALDTLSRTESCFMNCSVSGMSGVIDSSSAGPAGSFSTDPQVRDFMMGRFLPAAQAMATGSPQYASRKPSTANARESPARRVENGGENRRRRPVPLPYQHRPNYVARYGGGDHNRVGGGDCEEDEDEDDDDDYYDDTGNLSIKGCGFLPRFCLKSSFCLLNPVPGVKARSRVPLPPARKVNRPVRTSHHGSLGEAKDGHPWEAVYKHRLGHLLHVDEGSKLTSESNQITNGSNSQTPDRSSPYRHSMEGSISPYQSDLPPSPFHEGKGCLGVPEHEAKSGKGDHLFKKSSGKDGEQYWEIMPDLSSKQGSASLSPTVERIVYVDSVNLPETPNSKSSSRENKGTPNSAGGDSEVAVESRRLEDILKLEARESNALSPKASEVIDADIQLSVDRPGSVEQTDRTRELRPNGSLDGPQPSQTKDWGLNDTNLLHSILPPPLPKSPSESWLWRTLPSVSTKKSTPQSFLGIQFPYGKQAVRASSTDPRWETVAKTSKLNRSQMLFSEILAKPVDED